MLSRIGDIFNNAKKDIRLRIKQFSMGMEWNSAMRGNFEEMEKWKDFTEKFRRPEDAIDIQNAQLDSIVLAAAKFENPNTYEALEDALQYLAYPKDHNGDIITADRMMNYIEQLDNNKRTQLLKPLYGDSTKPISDHCL
jgi:hypothetical protein